MLMMMIIAAGWKFSMFVTSWVNTGPMQERRENKAFYGFVQITCSSNGRARDKTKLPGILHFLLLQYEEVALVGRKGKEHSKNPLLQIKIIWGLVSYSAFSKGSHTRCQDGILGSDTQKYWLPMASQQNPCKVQLLSISNCSLAIIFSVAIALVPRCSILTAAKRLQV